MNRFTCTVRSECQFPFHFLVLCTFLYVRLYIQLLCRRRLKTRANIERIRHQRLRRLV